MMKYFVLSIFLMFTNICCADVHSRLEQKNARYSNVIIDGVEQAFEISKFCFPHQSWRLLEPLPEHVVCCGLEIKDDILYENDWVCGGPLIHEYRFIFKLTLKSPALISFELTEGQQQTTEITKVITRTGEFTCEVSNTPRDFEEVGRKLDNFDEWIHREKELMMRMDEMPVIFNERWHELQLKYGLTKEIRRIIFRVFFEEVAIISGDFSDAAQGNVELAHDLKKLFCVSFNRDEEVAQKELDEFCSKWGLEKIEISQAPLFGDVIYE